LGALTGKQADWEGAWLGFDKPLPEPIDKLVKTQGARCYGNNKIIHPLAEWVVQHIATPYNQKLDQKPSSPLVAISEAMATNHAMQDSRGLSFDGAMVWQWQTQ
jgi:hypothetical protein